MEIAYQSLSFKKRIKLGSILLIAATALAAFVLLAGYLLKTAQEESELPSDPPPIIIRTGSFIMESERVFQPDAANQRSYKNPQFSAIKGIRVVSYSENAQTQTIDKKFFEGKDASWSRGDRVQANIYIQTCELDPNGMCPSWSPLKKVEVSDTSGSFEVKVPEELRLSKSKKNKKNKRPFKNEDENTEAVRFYMVEIINKTKNIQIAALFALEGQEYYIGFYNTLVNKSLETSAQ